MYPVYEHDQIITEQDLLAFQKALMRVYKNTPWYRPITKWATGVAVGVVMGLTTWLREGKSQIKGESK